MNGFLANIIGRHLGTVETVQPRLRSVFEPESPAAGAVESSFPETAAEKAGTHTPVETQATVPGVSTLDTPPPVSRQAEPIPFAVRQSAGSAEGSGPDPQTQAGGPESLMHELRALRAQSGLKAEPLESLKNDSRPVITAPAEATVQIFGERVAKAAPAGEIEAVVKRLSDQANRLAEVERRLQDPTQTHQVLNDDRGLIPLITEPVQPATKNHEPGTIGDESLKVRKPADTAPVNRQSGILQTPQWLETLRAELSGKWREANAQAPSEPVINVTIGRVEVRAINPDRAKAQAAEQKPTGVMSLDDYLKRRESQGAK